MPYLPPNRQRHSTEGIKVLATVCIFSVFGHLCQFPVMLQIYFRPAVQCNSTLVLFCYLSSVCLFYFRFYYCLHICANKDSRWADDAHLPSVIPSIKVSTRASDKISVGGDASRGSHRVVAPVKTTIGLSDICPRLWLELYRVSIEGGIREV